MVTKFAFCGLCRVMHNPLSPLGVCAHESGNGNAPYRSGFSTTVPKGICSLRCFGPIVCNKVPDDIKESSNLSCLKFGN